MSNNRNITNVYNTLITHLGVNDMKSQLSTILEMDVEKSAYLSGLIQDLYKSTDMSYTKKLNQVNKELRKARLDTILVKSRICFPDAKELLQRLATSGIDNYKTYCDARYADIYMVSSAPDAVKFNYCMLVLSKPAPEDGKRLMNSSNYTRLEKVYNPLEIDGIDGTRFSTHVKALQRIGKSLDQQSSLDVLVLLAKKLNEDYSGYKARWAQMYKKSGYIVSDAAMIHVAERQMAKKLSDVFACLKYRPEEIKRAYKSKVKLSSFDLFVEDKTRYITFNYHNGQVMPLLKHIDSEETSDIKSMAEAIKLIETGTYLFDTTWVQFSNKETSTDFNDQSKITISKREYMKKVAMTLNMNAKAFDATYDADMVRIADKQYTQQKSKEDRLRDKLSKEGFKPLKTDYQNDDDKDEDKEHEDSKSQEDEDKQDNGSIEKGEHEPEKAKVAPNADV